jgi:GNAT superfamily N-acetyltransferase
MTVTRATSGATFARYARGDSIVVAAFDGDRMVGAATGMPLADHADDFAAAFSGTDIDMKDVFYCAESVLLSEFRGQGGGHVFFDRREAHAARLGFRKVAFCGVVRPPIIPTGPRATARSTGSGARGDMRRLTVSSPISAGAISARRRRRKKPLQFWMRTCHEDRCRRLSARRPDGLGRLRGQDAHWVDPAVAAKADLLVFPEYGRMELATLDGPEAAGDLERSLHAAARWTEKADALIDGLAREHGVHILAGSGPVFDGGARPVNRAASSGRRGRWAFRTSR